MKRQSIFSLAATLVTLGATVGCSDYYGEGTERRSSSRVVEETGVPDGPRVRVNAPGVTVDTDPASPAAPGAKRKVDVNVGPGDVRVDVDGKPLRERLRETRAPRPATETQP